MNLVLFFAACCFATQTRAESTRPNIVIVLTDDAGYSDIGCYGGEIETPNIDALADRGLRFRRFYTNARCSPTRASLLTGQYPHTVGVGDLCRQGSETPFPGYLGYLDRNCTTLAEVLRDAGYRTVMSGKWHLGGVRTKSFGDSPFEPLEGERSKWPRGRGFDHFFGLLHGQTDYFHPHPSRPFILEDSVYAPEDAESFYATDAITEYALRFLEEAKEQEDRPFFLYVAYTAPHEPLAAREERLDKYREIYKSNWGRIISDRQAKLIEVGLLPVDWERKKRVVLRDLIPRMTKIAAMVEGVDDGVGRIVEALRRSGDLENTLIFFLSDNGPASGHTRISNFPFEGGKGSLKEGGTLTHCVVSWPERIEANKRAVDFPGHVIDIMPTCLEAAGAIYPSKFRGRALPALEGVSLIEAFPGYVLNRPSPLFWAYQRQQAMIKGPWKLWIDQDRVSLFNLEKDPTERIDLSEMQPVLVREMMAELHLWARRCNVLPYDQVHRAQSASRARLERLRREAEKVD